MCAVCLSFLFIRFITFISRSFPMCSGIFISPILNIHSQCFKIWFHSTATAPNYNETNVRTWTSKHWHTITSLDWVSCLRVCFLLARSLALSRYTYTTLRDVTYALHLPAMPPNLYYIHKHIYHTVWLRQHKLFAKLSIDMLTHAQPWISWKWLCVYVYGCFSVATRYRRYRSKQNKQICVNFGWKFSFMRINFMSSLHTLDILRAYIFLFSDAWRGNKNTNKQKNKQKP